MRVMHMCESANLARPYWRLIEQPSSKMFLSSIKTQTLNDTTHPSYNFPRGSRNIIQ